MKIVSTAELKAHLGKYLGMVKEGETVYVTSHRKPVAQLAPSHPSDLIMIEPPSRSMAELKAVKGVRLGSGVDGVQALLTDRRRR